MEAGKTGSGAEKKLFFDRAYFITGTAYAGKSTMVRLLAQKHGGILCEENYHDRLLDRLEKEEFPCLCYTRDLELRILEDLAAHGKAIFADTNISLETLKRIAPREHVLVMLADPEISVRRFFERPDRDKQFLYRLIQEEPDPASAMENYRRGLMRINSPERYARFARSGFPVILRDERRNVDETLALVEKAFGLD